MITKNSLSDGKFTSISHKPSLLAADPYLLMRVSICSVLFISTCNSTCASNQSIKIAKGAAAACLDSSRGTVVSQKKGQQGRHGCHVSILIYRRCCHLAGVCRLLVFGGLGGVALAPSDLARRVFFTAVTGDAIAPSALPMAC